MDTDPEVPALLLKRVDAALMALAGIDDANSIAVAKPLVEELRNARNYACALRLSEAVRRQDRSDAKNRRLQAQALIESGYATVAVDVLDALASVLPVGDPERAEAMGLRGRAHKQIFFDAGDKSTDAAQTALAAAIAAYRDQYEADGNKNTWHGVNLLALICRARRMGLRAAPDLQPKRLAQRLVDTLLATPTGQRDEWFLPALAEASLGLGDYSAVERTLREYASKPDVPAFLIDSTLRQFDQVWDIDHGDLRGHGLVQILRARLLQLPFSELSVTPGKLREMQAQAPPSAGQLEAVLGQNGPQTYAWWMTGMQRAKSVAAIRQRLGNRVGTGFLVRAGDFGLAPADELMVLTNFHVVNENGVSPGIRPRDALVVFEAVDHGPSYEVSEIVWTESSDRHDASLLRLDREVTNVDPLPIAATLPNGPINGEARMAAPRVYVIGYPGGRDLSFSFQDNELLGHEGPPNGKPSIEGVCRVHYRAPTEGGSSGSPVFNDSTWEVIAIHHMGGQIGMPRLNGEAGSYAANEGIAMLSIVATVSNCMRAVPDRPT